MNAPAVIVSNHAAEQAAERFGLTPAEAKAEATDALRRGNGSAGHTGRLVVFGRDGAEFVVRVLAESIVVVTVRGRRRADFVPSQGEGKIAQALRRAREGES